MALSESGPRSARCHAAPPVLSWHGGCRNTWDKRAAHKAGDKKAQRGPATRPPSRKCCRSWRGGPCGRSLPSVLGSLPPGVRAPPCSPLLPPPSPTHGARVSRGEGRANTGSFAPILRWDENRELLVYFVTSETDQLAQVQLRALKCQCVMKTTRGKHRTEPRRQVPAESPRGPERAGRKHHYSANASSELQSRFCSVKGQDAASGCSVGLLLALLCK